MRPWKKIFALPSRVILANRPHMVYRVDRELNYHIVGQWKEIFEDSCITGGEVTKTVKQLLGGRAPGWMKFAQSS